MDIISDPRRRILIVDDEPSVRLLLSHVLGKEFRCETVASAEDALKTFSGGEFSLVISDVHLGGLGGIELINALYALRPGTAFILMSGGRMDHAASKLEAPGVETVSKPFEYHDLVELVRRMLAESSIARR